MGDGGGGGDPFKSAQNLGMLLGKILRIDVDVVGDPPPPYEIPPDNPFVSAPAGAMHEVWAFGLRNPWRISFDRLAGDLFIGDVGQGAREEVDFQLAGSAGGANYGWSRMEGIACYPPGSGCQATGITLPILDYTHSEGCAVTGGYRYRGAAIPTLNGVYVFSDYCSGVIWGGVQAGNGTWSRVQLLSSGLSPSTFGEDAWGEFYVAHLGGSIHRFTRVRPRLTITQSGVGTGTVNGPGGIACGDVCTAEFEPGESVTLTTAIDANSWLAGWGGACGGAGDCTVVMDGDRSVTVTINPRSVFQFSAPTYTVNEGSGAATITVQRLAATVGTARVNYAIEAGTATAPPAADADFSGPVSGTLTFNSGESVKTFTVPIVNDTRAEGPETILLSLHHYPLDGSVLGNQASAVLTIVDNDTGGTVQFGQTAYSTSEASGSFAVPLQRSGGGADVSVTWTITGNGSAQPGVDFVTPNGQLTGTIPIPANMGGASLPADPAAADRYAGQRSADDRAHSFQSAACWIRHPGAERRDHPHDDRRRQRGSAPVQPGHPHRRRERRLGEGVAHGDAESDGERRRRELGHRDGGVDCRPGHGLRRPDQWRARLRIRRPEPADRHPPAQSGGGPGHPDAEGPAQQSHRRREPRAAEHGHRDDHRQPDRARVQPGELHRQRGQRQRHDHGRPNRPNADAGERQLRDGCPERRHTRPSLRVVEQLHSSVELPAGQWHAHLRRRGDEQELLGPALPGRRGGIGAPGRRPDSLRAPAGRRGKPRALGGGRSHDQQRGRWRRAHSGARPPTR